MTNVRFCDRVLKECIVIFHLEPTVGVPQVQERQAVPCAQDLVGSKKKKEYLK